MRRLCSTAGFAETMYGGSQAELCRVGTRRIEECHPRHESLAAAASKSYHIGTRGCRIREPGERSDVISWWQRQVEFMRHLRHAIRAGRFRFSVSNRLRDVRYIDDQR